MRGIFVGILDDSVGWLFYVPSLRRTYISMDASFDERFTSSFAVPGLPFEGAVKLRHIDTVPQKQVDSTEYTGTSVGSEETYPTDNGLPVPIYQQTIADITHLSESKRGARTRKEHHEETAITAENNSEKSRAHFVNMGKIHCYKITP